MDLEDVTAAAVGTAGLVAEEREELKRPARRRMEVTSVALLISFSVG